MTSLKIGAGRYSRSRPVDAKRSESSGLKNELENIGRGETPIIPSRLSARLANASLIVCIL
jgi:hypothetical protein